MFAVVFSSNDILAVMRKLQPSNVPSWVEDLALPPDQRFSQLDDSESLVARSHMNSRWHRDVANPTAMIVGTMQELSLWGSSMGASIVCCWGACLCWIPTVAARPDVQTASSVSSLVALASLPMLVAFAPALVSNRCDMLLNQLNDISFMVSVMPEISFVAFVALKSHMLLMGDGDRATMSSSHAAPNFVTLSTT